MTVVIPNTLRKYEDMIVSSTLPNDFSFPTWNGTATFYQGNMVHYNGKLYRALEENKNKQPDTYKDDFWYEWGVWDNVTDPSWSVATPYNIGDIVTYRSGYKNYIYQAAEASTGVPPTSDDIKWTNIGAINLYRCLINETENKTEYEGNFTVVLNSNRADYVSLIGLRADSVSIVVKSGATIIDTISYNLNVRDTTTWKEYFYGVFTQQEKFGTYIPIGDYTVEITLNSTSIARLGNIIIGRSYYIGETQYGASAGILDFSVAQRDDRFGDVFLKTGSYADRMDLVVFVDTPKADAVKNYLTRIRGTEVLVLGDNRDLQARFEMLQVRGSVRDFNVTLSNVKITELSVEVEGLI